MKSRLFLAVAVLLVIGYGCQDESTTNETIAPVQNSDAPVVETNAALDGPAKEFPLEMNKEANALTLTDYPILETTQTNDDVTSRSAYELNLNASVVKSLSCGSNTNQTLHDNSNKVSDNVYAHFGYNTDLNGRDEIYRLQITQSSIVTINLTHTTRNLAMVLFKVGAINCTSIGTCRYSLTEVEDVTNSYSEYSDQVGPLHLTPGTYLLVVDSKVNQSSNYSLKVNCTTVYTGCVTGTTRLQYDDFDDYQFGNVSPQSTAWFKWYSTATYDATVAGSTSNKYLYLVRKDNVTTTNQPNVLWRHGYRNNTGSYAIKMSLYVPQHRSAYLNLQKRLSYPNSNNEYGASIYFESDGTGKVHIGGSDQHFTYPQAQWITVQFTINLSANRVYFYINGTLKESWPCSSTYYSTGTNKSIEAIQFYPYASHSQFYVDNLCFSKYY